MMQPTPNQIRVFISHAPEDDARCQPLRDAFTAWGISYAETPKGTDENAQSAQTQQALVDCTVFLRICTEYTVRSYWMGIEMSTYLSLQADDFRVTRTNKRAFISLIMDTVYVKSPFDMTSTIVTTAKRQQVDWLRELRAVMGLSPVAEAELAAIPRFTPVTVSRRRALRLGVAGGAVVVAAGLGGAAWLAEQKHLFGLGSGPSVIKAQPTATPRAATTASDPLWTYKTGDSIGFVTPIVANGVLCFSSYDSVVYALNSQTGTLLWNTPKKSGINLFSPALIDTTIAISVVDGNVVAYELTTGKLVWNTTGGPSSTSVIAGNATFYVCDNQGDISGLNPKTGAAVYNAGPGFTTAAGFFRGLTYSNGVLMAGDNEGNVAAYDTIHTTQAVGGAAVGPLLWSFNKTGKAFAANPTVANNSVYVGSDDHSFYALDARTGKQLWSYPTDDVVETQPVVANGMVYFGSSDHTFYALDAKTGAVRWKFKAGDVIRSSPTLANGIIYFGSFDHNVYALRASDGTKVMQYHLGGKVGAQPVVANGIVYVGCGDDYMYAFKAAA